MSGIEFEYWEAFLLLPLYFVGLKFFKQRGVSFYFPNIALLKVASKKSQILLNMTKFLALFCMVLALSSPIKEDTITQINDKGYEISLILDASGSMRQGGKFDVVKSIVKDFINRRVHDKLALSIFADFAYVAVPLTYDKKSIKRLLSKIEVGIAGNSQTALYEALFLSSNLFKNSHAKRKIAILLTDGVDNTDSIPLSVAINTAKKYGIKVYTIGVGSEGEFNPYILQDIAKKTGGKYFNAYTKQALEDIYNNIDRLEKSDIKADKYVKKRYFFQYPLAFAILFLILYFYLTNRKLR